MKSRTLVWMAAILVMAVAVGLFAQHRLYARGMSTKPLDITLTDTAGKKIKLADYRGKVVVVDVWATWCGYCVKEIPGLIELQAEATKEKVNLQIIGLSIDTDKDAVKDFVKEHKLNYPVAVADKAALEPFGDLPGVPTKFVINEKGVIVERFVGAMSKETLQKRLEKYLK